MQHSPKNRKGLFASESTLRGSISTEDLNITQRTKRQRQFEEPESTLCGFKEEIKTMISTLFQAQQLRLEALEGHIKDVKGQNQDIRTTSQDIEKSMDFVCQQLKDIDMDIKKLNSDNKNLQLEINNITERVSYLEQKSNKTSVEIRNVLKIQNETKCQLYNMITTLAKTLKLNISNSDIRDVSRVPTKKEVKYSALVVEFQTTLKKSDFLLAAKSHNLNKNNPKLSATHLGLQGVDSPIYMSELLSKRLKKIFYEAKNFAKEHKFAHCWISNGRILLREKDGGPYIVIQCTEQLLELKKASKTLSS